MRLRAALLFSALVACGGLDQSASQSAKSDLGNDPFATTCPAGATVPGIDVSSYQGASINWAGVKSAGTGFAIAKASEGLTVDDADFHTNWNGIKAAGMVRGAYHFFHPADDGAAQADVFLAQTGTLGESGDLPPVLDWEVTDTGVSTATAIAQAQKFIDEIHAKTGLETIIYTYPSFWQGLGSPAQFKSHPFWVANYTGAITSCPIQLSPWTSWNFWQWADSGSQPGDQDVFNGSSDALRAWATPPVAQVSGNDALTAINWPDQHIELFASAAGGSAVHVWTSGAGDAWSGPAAIAGGSGSCGASAVLWGAPWTYPEVFAPFGGAGGHYWWTGSGWHAWQTLNGPALSHFGSAARLDGQVEVFALGADSAIWTDAWSTSAVDWSGWSSLGGSFSTGASPIVWGNGTVEIFATSAGGVVSHAWKTAASSSYSAWAQLGTGMASRPVAVRWSDGGLGHAEVFARGTDGRLYHTEFSSSWPAFSAIDASTEIAGEPSAMMDSSGPIVVARDPAGHVLHADRSGSGYSAFAQIGSLVAASDPFIWRRGDGAAEVFAIDSAGALWHSLRSGSTWGAWGEIGSGFDDCAPSGGGGAPDAGTPDAGVADAGSGSGGNDAGSGSGGNDAGSGSGGNDAGSGASDAGSGASDAGSGANDAGSGSDDAGSGGASDGGAGGGSGGGGSGGGDAGGSASDDAGSGGDTGGGATGGSTSPDGGVTEPTAQSAGCTALPPEPLALLALGLFFRRARRRRSL